jgi:integrase
MKKINVVTLNLNNYGQFFTFSVHNKLFEPVTRYLLWKIHNSSRNRPLAFSSQRQYAYHLVYLFKYLDKNKQEWNKINSRDIRQIRDYLDQIKNISRNTINRKTYIWVDFYQWCIDNFIEVNLVPKYKKIKKKYDSDDKFLGYINKGDFIYVNEFHLTPLRSSSIYKVLSVDEVLELLLQLRSIDIMYEAIAIVMVTTGLRIGEVLQLRNTTFLPALILENKNSLEYYYVPKGEISTGKKVSCNFPFDTWEYLSTVIFKARNHILRSNKKKSNYLFIGKKGNEIKAHHIQKRFRELSSKENTRKIIPHMLRHTYATWNVIEWAKENKITSISESFYMDIHESISEQLNHKNIATTKKYCKTASRYKFSKILPQVNEKVLSKLHIQESLEYLKKEGYE